MSVLEILTTIEESGIGIIMRESFWLFPTVESLHVLALAIFFGSLAVVDLRLLGVASTNKSVSIINSDLMSWVWVSFIICLITGPIMFAAHAIDYYNQYHFRMKFLFLLLAGINMLIFHFGIFRSVAQWENAASPPLAAKVAGGLSLCFWIMVIGYGRWIGFHYD